MDYQITDVVSEVEGQYGLAPRVHTLSSGDHTYNIEKGSDMFYTFQGRHLDPVLTGKFSSIDFAGAAFIQWVACQKPKRPKYKHTKNMPTKHGKVQLTPKG